MKKSVFVYQVISVCEVLVDGNKFWSALDKRKEAIRMVEAGAVPLSHNHERLIALTFDAEKEVIGVVPEPINKSKKKQKPNTAGRPKIK